VEVENACFTKSYNLFKGLMRVTVIWVVCMRNLMPEIQRDRLIVEGFYDADMCEKFLRGFLIGLSEALGMRIIEGPFIFSPDKFSSFMGVWGLYSVG
jgi:hypothetical protein